jgi:hypothetical protein
LEQAGLIDNLWGAIEDIQGHNDLDDCRIVYFIRRRGATEVKVGFARDPISRLRRLQCGNALDLCIEHQVPTVRYRELERWIHVHLTAEGAHIKGEWFHLATDTDYRAVVDAAICARVVDEQNFQFEYRQ